MPRWFVIFRDFRALKLVFALMTAYLLYDEISIFISKPTFTSLSQAYLRPEHFPEIQVCPVPAFLQAELERHGYQTSYDFVLGNMRNTDLKGWSGNHSDANLSVSALAAMSDCPSVSLKFKKDQTILWLVADLALTRDAHPSGKCCKAGFV